jgi:hypothetical protein
LEVASDASSNKPYILGSTPYITEISSGINILIVFFNPSIGGNPSADKYKYSVDNKVYIEGNAISTSNVNIWKIEVPVESKPDVSYRVKIRSYNTLYGDGLESNELTGSPYFAPQISSLKSGYEYITVNFIINNSIPAPTEVLYSINNSIFVPADQLQFPLYIDGLKDNTSYSVKIKLNNGIADSPESNVLSIWTKSKSTFFRDVMNSSGNRNEPIYIGDQPVKNKFNSGGNDVTRSTRMKYSQYVNGTRNR